MKLARTADQIAELAFDRGHRSPVDTTEVRDWCDTTTGGELPPSMLDRLQGMVMIRLLRMPS